MAAKDKRQPKPGREPKDERKGKPQGKAKTASSATPSGRQEPDTHPDRLDPLRLYENFPTAADHGFGPEQGFGRLLQVNDVNLFKDEALRDPDIGPTLRAFCGVDENAPEEPLKVYFLQLKSSTRESEVYVHLPTRWLAGQIDDVPPPSPEPVDLSRLQTLVMKHELTLAKMITRSMLVTEKDEGAQVVHKQSKSP